MRHILLTSILVLTLSSGITGMAYAANSALYFPAIETSDERFIYWHNVVSLPDPRVNPAGFDFSYTSFTVEAWIKPEKIDNGVIMAGGNISARKTTDGFILYLWKGASPDAPEGCSNLNPDATCVKFAIKSEGRWYAATAYTGTGLTKEWHHIAGVYDFRNASLTVYVNGIALKGADRNHPNPLNVVSGVREAGSIFIGANQCFTPEMTIGHEKKNHETHPAVKHWFRGTIDEVRLWREARTADQIRRCMKVELGKSGACMITDNLATYLTFNEGTGSTVYDHSGNRNNASIRYYQRAKDVNKYKDHKIRIGYHTQVKDHESLEILGNPVWVSGYLF
jgi:hypothetical protein